MAAFERINFGIPSLDSLLDNIRFGDNVVIQVSDLKDYMMLVRIFVQNCLREGKKVNYIRFASHEEILTDKDTTNTYILDPNHGFENFTMQTRKIIENQGLDAIYVFDCLSDLQTIWSTDLMMGNFFCVTCPYLFELDTVAFFPILRGHH
ncbi:MAG: phosphoenolpyruvate synthase, partial [Clostridia bacterium]|nr:phosphoenolpyruvate synthase [Clostridia bacterium]